MWGLENWGQMYWGAFVPVPAMNLAGCIALLASMLWTARLAMRGTRLRRIGWLGLSLFLAAPLVSRAAYELPNLFVNGTIADANAVNDNFEAITEDFKRFQLQTSGPVGDSVPVPVEVMDQLCGDDDGCVVKLLHEHTQPISGGGSATRMTGGTPMHMRYTVTSGSVAPRAFSVGSTGVFDGDGYGPSQYQLFNAGNCAFEDFQRISGSPQPDGTVGMWLVMFNVGSTRCTLVIDD